MEHLRSVVTVSECPTTTTSPETDDYGVPTTIDPIRRPPARSNSPSNAQKRSDPFQFGSRYLEEGDDIFAFNAWDHVEVDSVYTSFAEQQYTLQRSAPVSDFDRKRFNDDPAKWWDLFYKQNAANFFKNRKWLAQEFPVLAEVTKEGAGRKVLLEVGAGAGNTAFPIVDGNQNAELRIHACDFSKRAVEVIRQSPKYDSGIIKADVWDVAASAPDDLPPGIEEGSVDFVLMIFIFSALAPEQWERAVRNIWRVLRPGGQVLFRDYGKGDLAQVRFKKGRWMGENFYVRGDGTRVYFFEREELVRIWGGKSVKGEPEEREEPFGEGTSSHNNTAPGEKSTDTMFEPVPPNFGPIGISNTTPSSTQTDPEIPTGLGPRPAFETVNIGVDRRMLVNRQRRLKMYRCWMQAVFQKPEQ